LNPRSFTIFSTDDVSGVKNFKYMGSGFLWFLICVLVQVLFLSLALNFSLFNSYFSVTTLGLDLFSGAYINKLLFLWCPVTENSLI